MNKYCYRVIFSKTQQQFIVVSEIAKTAGQAKSEGKISAETESMKTLAKLTALFSPIPQSVFKPLSFALLCAWGLVSMQSAYANPTNSPLMIQADPTAQANQRPQVMEAANGTPQVNIQTPNQQGLSYNRYSQFDVDKKGAILNNSRKDTQTQLGGWVQANPYLAGGEAKVIVNEVNSNKPSQLKGYVEVAGQKADVIIANPSGLHCEGCGVINADRATLTTGKPQLKQGHLDHFVVEKGKVTVSGKGLDNSQSNYTDIIAREAEINAGVWSKKAVNVTTGKNKVSKNNDAVQIIHSKSQNNQKEEKVTEYALDVSNLGGMYAEKIHLIGTEAGLGVRNAGHIGASAGDVVIDVNGKIVNQHRIQAQQHVILNAKGDKGSIDNMASAQVLANQGRINVQAEKTLNQSGVIGAKQQIAVQAEAITQSKTGEIQGGEVRLTAQGQVVNRGLINSKVEDDTPAKTVIKADKIENVGTGRIYGDKVALAAKIVENIDEIDPGNQQRQDPIIAAYSRLDVAGETLTNQTTNYVAAQKGAATLYSEKDIVFGRQLNEQDEAIGKAVTLLNDSSTIEAANGNVILNVDTVKNINSHFKAEIERQSDESINETYIIPQGYATKDRIDYNKLKWISFSRAGKLAFRSDTAKQLQPGEEITSTTLLPTVNEYQCEDYTNPISCQLKPESVYTADNPAWVYFNVTPPSVAPTHLPQLDYPDEPVKPKEVPALEGKRRFESEADYQQRLADYEKAKADYEKALIAYESEKRTYPERLAAYEQAMAPFKTWIIENETAFEALNQRINGHNSRILGITFSDFWITKLNRRVKDLSVVKTTLPAQILAGKTIQFNSQAITNDRSQIIAGGALTLTGHVDHQDETGYNILNEYGTSQWTNNRWRGGFKRYHQRDWGSVYGYNNHVNTPFQMGIAIQEENKNYKENEATNPATIIDKKDIALLPNSSLYKLNPAADSHVLVETDPAFANRKKWLSSDYMFNLLRADHNRVHKRLGDGFYEQRLIREQINQLTGRQFLSNYQDMETQYKALMDNGITFAKKFHLTPGISLSPEQVAQLTSDIVWFEQQTVTLPDGGTQQVLAPRVYAVVRKEDVNGQGTLLGAKQVIFKGDTLQSSALIAGREVVALQADKIENKGGDIVGSEVYLSAKEAIRNIGGQIIAQDNLVVQSQGNIEHTSTTTESEAKGQDYSRANTTLARKALLHVKNKDGGLLLGAQNIHLAGADILNEGGTTLITAKNQLKLTALEIVTDEKMGQGDHYRNERVQDVVVSRVKGAGDVKLQAYNIATEGAKLESAKKLTALAENELVLSTAKTSYEFDEYHHRKSGGLTKKTKTTLDKKAYEINQGSIVSAGEVYLHSGNAVQITGSDVVSDSVTQITGKDIHIAEAQDKHYQESFSKQTKSGLLGSGGIGFTIGKQNSTTESDKTKYLARGSQVGSLRGEVNIIADNQYTQQASTVSALEKDVNISAQQVNIKSADEQYESHFKHTFEQKGLTIALTGTVADAIQGLQALKESAETVGKSKDDRVNAMAAANAGYEAYRNLQTLSKLQDAAKALSNGKTPQDASVGVSITYGQQKNVQTTDTIGNTAAKSAVNAGGKVNIQAKGKGEQSTLNIIGSDVLGRSGTTLNAEGNVNIIAAQQTYSERSKNRSSGFNAGVAVNFGSNGFSFGITAGGNYGRGYGNGDEMTYRYSHVGDKHSHTQIHSGGTATLKGGQIQGNKIHLVADNLNIESLQETMTYQGKQMNVSGQITVGYGVSGSASFNQSKINADYASIIEQSGIYAGDGGYDIYINKHTDLKGGLITSSAQAEQDKQNRFSTGTLSHLTLQNKANYSGSSLGISGGLSYGGGESMPKEVGGMVLTPIGQNQTVESTNSQGEKSVRTEGSLSANKSIGFGRDSESQSSVTKSGINTTNIEIRDKAAQQLQTGKTAEAMIHSVKTDTTLENAVANSGKLAQNFDKDKVQAELDLQRNVTQKFDQNRQDLKAQLYAKVDEKRAKATEIRRNNQGYDTEESKRLDQEANSLDETVRWVDMGLGAVLGLGDESALWKVYATTQADRALRSATRPKEMWFQTCDSSNGECNRDEKIRQIWSLNDLSAEEQKALRENNNLLTISNPGIFNDREDALKNAQKQNTSGINQRGIIVVMNSPTGDYKGWGGWKILTSLPSELMYAAYDKVNDKFLSAILPLSNAQKLNQDLYIQAMNQGYQLDLSNHSRGGLTASIALKDINTWKGVKHVPIRKSRFYGTATNVSDYAEQLKFNGYSYTDKDGSVYESSAYSAVHKADAIGNKWNLGLMGFNESSGGTCWICYSHSSYYAEVPDKTMIDSHGNVIENPAYKDFAEKWGEVDIKNPVNPSLPKLVRPANSDGGVLNDKAF
ncbi:hemagglutinin repeat-containing protein [Pasteurella multocida]|nr:hemagglutinin repeat-containing protein [Pasteurella multocida]HDR1027181.1 hemagglutinin repeat-containing protein [Pasteurella multocida]